MFHPLAPPLGPPYGQPQKVPWHVMIIVILVADSPLSSHRSSQSWRPCLVPVIVCEDEGGEYAEWRDPVYGLDAYRRMEDSDRKPKRWTVLKSRLGYWYNIARRRQLLTSRFLTCFCNGCETSLSRYFAFPGFYVAVAYVK
ncbi:hypothetical protein EDD18DRAFT_1098836 [Armillaria luteobubalina]|uniref:Uncharacterized protein n=1 Tax=Armillaria luteobubalina TaxID=153913 RepID=A0AA39QNC9_9AGAR|nr:hypothetical protein EDD18DRAFT_1098836 [Armillaria luteobubalina]